MEIILSVSFLYKLWVHHHVITLICYSSDGGIKVWDESKVLVTEVMLEESLSAATFLNEMGDLLVGFKNHIFYIDHTKCKYVSTYSYNIAETEWCVSGTEMLSFAPDWGSILYLLPVNICKWNFLHALLTHKLSLPLE